MTVSCSSSNCFDVQDDHPGEALCGVDYTGWTLDVVEVVA